MSARIFEADDVFNDAVTAGVRSKDGVYVVESCTFHMWFRIVSKKARDVLHFLAQNSAHLSRPCRLILH